MIKRTIDVLVSLFGLLVASPVLLIVMIMIWLGDRQAPLYIASRVARGGGQFRMIKLRSMVIGADRSGVSSTSSVDQRITSVGRFIRRFKLDEVTQLWNVLMGDMSLVGPRPQVQAGVDLYTRRERQLLSVRPGITDISSIVFSDEGAILQHSRDPDADYNLLIRPWKGRLGLIYVERRSVLLDVQLILVTLVAVFSRRWALANVARLLRRLNAPEDVIRMASRVEPLVPALPPDDSFRVCNVSSDQSAKRVTAI